MTKETNKGCCEKCIVKGFWGEPTCSHWNCPCHTNIKEHECYNGCWEFHCGTCGGYDPKNEHKHIKENDWRGQVRTNLEYAGLSPELAENHTKMIEEIFASELSRVREEERARILAALH